MRIKQETGASVTGTAADVGNAEGVKQLLEQLGDVDILINNAGIFEPKPFLEIGDADWLRFFDVNVMSGVRLFARAAALYAEAKLGADHFHLQRVGTANFGGDGALRHDQDGAACGQPRHRRERRGHWRHPVNAVLPGPTRSEGAIEFLEKIARERGVDVKKVEVRSDQDVAALIPDQTHGRSDEVANLAVYLCGEPASATTGASLRVDGGVVRTIA